MADLPTRQFVIPPTPSPLLPPGAPPPVPGLAPPQSWSDEEGTAALLLPEAGMLLPERPAPSRPSGAAPIQPGARAVAPGRRRANLVAGLVGGVLAVIVVLVGGRLLSEPAGGPLTAAQQVTIDEAMRAVADGQPDRAVELLQRLRDSRPETSLDGLIAALKRQATGRGPVSQPVRK
jgi:hypothetical protein